MTAAGKAFTGAAAFCSLTGAGAVPAGALAEGEHDRSKASATTRRDIARDSTAQPRGPATPRATGTGHDTYR